MAALIEVGGTMYGGGSLLVVFVCFIVVALFAVVAVVVVFCSCQAARAADREWEETMLEIGGATLCAARGE